jgi:hypothetical protein
VLHDTQWSLLCSMKKLYDTTAAHANVLPCSWTGKGTFLQDQSVFDALCRHLICSAVRAACISATCAATRTPVRKSLRLTSATAVPGCSSRCCCTQLSVHLRCFNWPVSAITVCIAFRMQHDRAVATARNASSGACIDVLHVQMQTVCIKEHKAIMFLCIIQACL